MLHCILGNVVQDIVKWANINRELKYFRGPDRIVWQARSGTRALCLTRVIDAELFLKHTFMVIIAVIVHVCL